MGVDVCRGLVFHPAMSRPTRSQWVCALAICAGLALAACSSKPENSIVGKWAKGNDTIFTFTKDGTMTKQEGITTEEMEYSVQDGNTLFLKPKDLPMSIQFSISFPSENEIILTPQQPKGAITQPQSLEPVHLTRVPN
jgi:hypothetical protein